MKVVFNTQNFNIAKINPIKNDYKYQSNSTKNGIDSTSFGANAYYKNAKNIYSAIGRAKRVGILVHKDVDADALSSGLLLLTLLKRKYRDKDIQFVLNQDIPKYLSKIPFISEITQYKDLQDKNFDTVVVLDCDDSRVDCSDIFDKAGVKINIDHHKKSENSPNFMKPLSILNPNAVSTTQLLYDNLMMPFGIKPNDSMIECILTGIVSDSGNFKNVPSQLDLTMTMDLLEQQSWIPIKTLVKNINNNFTTSKQRSEELECLYSEIASGKNIQEHITPSGRSVKYFVMDRNLLDKYKVKDNEADIKEVINSLVSMNKSKCDVSAALWQRENGNVRLSLRSKDIEVLGIAEKFGGGGHPFAAGAPISGNLDEALEQVLDAFDAEL